MTAYYLIEIRGTSFALVERLTRNVAAVRADRASLIQFAKRMELHGEWEQKGGKL